MTGENFSSVKENNHVAFEGTSNDADIAQASATALSVIVPATALTGKVRVTVNNRTAISADDFIIDFTTPPSIVDFIPKQGAAGTIVMLSGTNFGSNITVSLNNIEARVTQKSATQLVFVVPDNNTLTSHKIKIVSDGITLETADNFTVISSGTGAQWIDMNINATPAPVFQSGLSFVYKNKIYWGFSKLSFNQSHTDYMVFDPATPDAQWVMGISPPADMTPASLQSATAVVYNDRVFIGTGITSAATNAWWEYHPESNTCTRMADYPEATAHAVGFIFNNKIYVGFGGTSNKLHQYDPVSNTWMFITNHDLQDMNDASVFVVGNEACIGRGLAVTGGERKEFRRFTGSLLLPATALPESIQSPETPSFVVGDKGYMVTGRKVWEYTPNTIGGSWKLVIDSPVNGPFIKYTGTVIINNEKKVLGWTDRGEMFEFKSGI